MITGTTITSAICRKLHERWPDISIYREHIDEDFDEPSFFVWSVNVSSSPRMWNRFIHTHKIEVNFFPKRGNTSLYSVLLDFGLELCEVLNSISVDIDETTMPVWAINPTYQIIDDSSLQWSADFQIEAVIEENEGTTMGQLSSTTHFK